MATKAELEYAIQVLDQRGDTEGVRRAVEALRSGNYEDAPQPQPTRREPNIPLSVQMQHNPEFMRDMVREGLQGASFGFSDELGAGAAAATAALLDGAPVVDTYRDMRDNLRSQQNVFREQNPGLALTANVVGGIGVGGPAKFFATKTGAALTGGAAGYGFSDQTNPLMQARDTAIGAAAGLGGQFVLSKAGEKIMGWVNRRLADGGIPLHDQTGRVSDDAVRAMEAELQSGRVSANEAGQFVDDMRDVLTPDQLRRLQLFEGRGVTPVRANVTQSTDDFRNLQETVKQSTPLAEAVASQDARLISLAEEGIEAMRPRAQNTIETNANVFRVVDDVVANYEKAVSGAYKAARDATGGERVVGFGRLTNTLRQNVGKERVSGGVISAVKQELKNRGIITSGWKATGRTDVNTAEEVRQALNALHDPANPRGNALIRELKDALDDDVAAVVDGDVFAGARQAHSDMRGIIERGRRDKRDKTKGGFLEDVLSNKIPEEKIVQRLTTGRDDDFLNFKVFLTEESGEAGLQAWRDIKAQVLRDAFDAATRTMGKGENGQVIFNSNVFSKKLINLRKSKKFNELFTPSERQLIDDIIEIGWLRVPQRSVQSGKGPSGFSVEEFRKAITQRLDHRSGVVERLLQEALSHKEVARQMNPGRETAEYLRTVRR